MELLIIDTNKSKKIINPRSCWDEKFKKKRIHF